MFCKFNIEDCDLSKWQLEYAELYILFCEFHRKLIGIKEDEAFTQAMNDIRNIQWTKNVTNGNWA